MKSSSNKTSSGSMIEQLELRQAAPSGNSIDHLLKALEEQLRERNRIFTVMLNRQTEMVRQAVFSHIPVENLVGQDSKKVLDSLSNLKDYTSNHPDELTEEEKEQLNEDIKQATEILKNFNDFFIAKLSDEKKDNQELLNIIGQQLTAFNERIQNRFEKAKQQQDDRLKEYTARYWWRETIAEILMVLATTAGMGGAMNMLPFTVMVIAGAQVTGTLAILGASAGSALLVAAVLALVAWSINKNLPSEPAVDISKKKKQSYESLKTFGATVKVKTDGLRKEASPKGNTPTTK